VAYTLIVIIRRFGCYTADGQSTTLAHTQVAGLHGGRHKRISARLRRAVSTAATHTAAMVSGPQRQATWCCPADGGAPQQPTSVGYRQRYRSASRAFRL